MHCLLIKINLEMSLRRCSTSFAIQNTKQLEMRPFFQINQNNPKWVRKRKLNHVKLRSENVQETCQSNN